MVVTISSWLNFGHAAHPGRWSVAGRKNLAPPYYSQCAVFASLWALFSCLPCFYYVQILIETLTLGSPLLLPPLHERMELLHSLLPHGPAGWDSLTHGQVLWVVWMCCRSVDNVYFIHIISFLSDISDGLQCTGKCFKPLPLHFLHPPRSSMF